MTHSIIDEAQAIAVAEEYLRSLGVIVDGVTEAHALRMSGDKRLKYRRDTEEFCRENGVTDVGEVSKILTESFLDEDHWIVNFYWIEEEPDTASTAPPTTVRVYDADGRAVLDRRVF